MLRLLRELAVDERGQALVEYSMLVAVVAVTIPALILLLSAMKSAYLRWNTGMLNLWQMPAPGGRR